VKFSAHVQTRIGDWQIIKELEDLGYDAAWVPDTQMQWSDCYAVMAVAAANTSRIRIGTGVAIPGCRIAPTTAAALASINELAPGRVFCGIGTGHTAMRIMGQKPMTIKNFREYLRVLRGLLSNEDVDFTYEGRTQNIRFMDHGPGFRNLTNPIPIYVAGNGPLALKTAGRYGDGLVSLFNEQPETLRYHMGMVREGAEEAGRALPADFYTTALTSTVVLQPGERLSSDRAIEIAGSWVVCCIHFVYEVWQYTKNDEVVPEYLSGIWEEYVDYVNNMETPVEKRYQQIHEGHCSFHPEAERRFITPEAIEGTCITGDPHEVAEKIRKAEAAGLSEVSLLPPLAHARSVVRDFAQKVIPLI
jgi:alkanesulfonate monooxygenase SsuD/methylene tetrahydromethanopterin reductase-like flavin-dependent oxidoreductase (luciferase family)